MEQDLNNGRSLNEENLAEYAQSIFLQYHAFVRYVAFKTAPRRDLVDDIVNDVFVRFVEKASQWEIPDNPSPLLRKITCNIAHEYWHQHLREIPVELQELENLIQQESESQSLQVENMTLEDEVRILTNCLDQLHPAHRALVEGHYFHHLSYSELAENFHKTEGAVQRMTSRIRVILRKCLQNAIQFIKGEKE